MGSFLSRIEFGAIIHDSYHWPPEVVAEAHACTDYDDWVTDQLREVVRAAAQSWLDARPGVAEIV